MAEAAQILDRLGADWRDRALVAAVIAGVTGAVLVQ